MKFRLLFVCCVFYSGAFAQILQLHYDLRHTVDPDRNPKNFCSLYFEYFKAQDSTSAFFKSGAFFLKVQTDMRGQQGNIAQSFIQASQSFRFWKPKINIAVQYSGGLGVTEPKQYSYYINNAFSVGPTYAFTWKGAFFSNTLSYTYNAMKKASNDLMYSFYWGKGFWNYKVEFAGDFELYTLSKNQGDAATQNLRGKRLCFFGEPQLWFNFNKTVGTGTRALLYYHVTTTDNVFQLYPTVALRFKL